MKSKTQERQRSAEIESAIGTMARADKGRVAPPPALEGNLREVADIVASWEGIIATVHWDLFRPSQIDGIDFYFGAEELGHIHLDGWAHIATSPSLGYALIERQLAQRFAYHRGWVRALIHASPDDVVAVFRSNYERLQALVKPVIDCRRYTGIL